MGLVDYATKVALALVPPHDANPEHQYRWRITVALLLTAVTVSQAVHILVACGWLASYGMPGFAYASDVDDVKRTQQRIETRQTRMEVRQIEGQLVAYQKSFCVALAEHKPTKFITDNIRNLEKEFEAITGEHWHKPSCDELGE